MILGESEAIVVSACVHRKESVSDFLMEGLTVDDFGIKASRLVMEVVIALYEEGLHGVEVVQTAMVDKGVMKRLGAERWKQLLTKGWSDSDHPFKYHLRALKKSAIVRRTSEIMESGILDLDTGTLEERVDAADRVLKVLSEISSGNVSELFTSAMLGKNMLSALENQNERVMRVPTGIPDIDRLTGGMIVNRINILAGQTNHGKSMCGDQIIINCATRWLKEGNPSVAVKFSAEDDALTNQVRMITNLTGLINPGGVAFEKTANHIQGIGTLSPLDLSIVREATDLFSKLPIVIDCTSSPSPEYMRSRLTSEASKRPIGLIGLDYIELVGSSVFAKKNETIDAAMVCMHELCRDFDTAFLALSQLKEAAMAREDGIPTLADLAWSSLIKKISPYVLMVHSPWEHWLQMGEKGEEPNPSDYWVYSRKNKGRVGNTKLKHNRDCIRLQMDASEYGGF